HRPKARAPTTCSACTRARRPPQPGKYPSHAAVPDAPPAASHTVSTHPPRVRDWGARGRVPGKPYRSRVERAGLDVPTMLVGLARVEAADFQLELVQHHAARYDPKAAVGGIQPVMTDRCLGRIHDRLAVHECRRSERPA